MLHSNKGQKRILQTNVIAGVPAQKSIVLHLTQRCNLNCKHCYSSASPYQQSGLNRNWLTRVLADLRCEGYDRIFLSGGEPFVHPEFVSICRNAKLLGYQLIALSNGTSINTKTAGLVSQYVSLAYVGIDGPQDLHDYLRGDKSFLRAVKGIQNLHKAKIAVGVSHCVTKKSMASLDWLVEFCLQNNVQQLQLQPLFAVGRGTHLYATQQLDDEDLGYLREFSQRINSETLAVEFTAVATDALESIKQSYLGNQTSVTGAKLSNTVNPLVVDAEGKLWPLSYGMEPSQCIAHGKTHEVREDIYQYKINGARPLMELLQHCFNHSDWNRKNYIDWYGLAVQCSWSQASRQAPSAQVSLP